MGVIWMFLELGMDLKVLHMVGKKNDPYIVNKVSR